NLEGRLGIATPGELAVAGRRFEEVEAMRCAEAVASPRVPGVGPTAGLNLAVVTAGEQVAIEAVVDPGEFLLARVAMIIVARHPASPFDHQLVAERRPWIGGVEGNRGEDVAHTAQHAHRGKRLLPRLARDRQHYVRPEAGRGLAAPGEIVGDPVE